MCKKDEKGMTLVVVLLLMAILTSLGMAFLHKAHTQTAATMTRGDGIQAQYLAESAANHAMWRLLNEPGFPAAEDTYYMHSLAGGRYGYKVRRHTATTFATIASVGAVGDNVVHQSHVLYVLPGASGSLYKILTVYSIKNSSIPKQRIFDDPGWSAEEDTLDLGENSHWVETAGKLSSREIIMGTLDNAHDINLAVWDGVSWGEEWEFSTTAKKELKCFDIAYESLSGDALIVGRNGTGNHPYYTMWENQTWVHRPPMLVNTSGGGEVQHIAAEPNPLSDEILITVGKQGDLALLQWDGDRFVDLGLLDTWIAGAFYQPADIAYEQSGEALIVWGQGTNLLYSTWDGSTLSNPQVFRNIGSYARIVRAVADPKGDTIIVGVLDSSKDLHLNIWDGTAWTDYREVEKKVYDNRVQCFDIAWESSGNEALIVWAKNRKKNLAYMRWIKGTALSSASATKGPKFGNQVVVVQALPLSDSDQIIVLGTTNKSDLKHTLWDGGAFAHDPAELLHKDLYIYYRMPFDLAETLSAAGPLSGTTVMETHFDADEEDLVYGDDLFRDTSQPDYATGSYTAADGYNGGGLRVIVGGIDNDDINGMSGGWQQNFDLTAPTEVSLSFRYKLTLSSEYESDEFGQALVSVDGTLYGKDPDDYVYQINGNGNGGSPDTSGWHRFEVDLGELTAGTHTLIIGAYNNKKTYSDETTEVLIDDVLITE